jgi:hypothetical protein
MMRKSRGRPIHSARSGHVQENTFRKAVDPFIFMPNPGGNDNEGIKLPSQGNPLPSFQSNPGGNDNEGIKLPSQGNPLHKEGKFMPLFRYSPRNPAEQRQRIAQRRQFYAQMVGAA